MYAKRNYSFKMTANWSKKPFLYGLVYATAICAIPIVLKIKFSLPWQPVSVIGIAVAFYLGFKNNSSYDRTWEARKIWGAIVNHSRSFGAATMAFVQGDGRETIQKELLYRHIAWMTALRYQLRLSKEWEHTQERIKGLYNPTVCENYYQQLDTELLQYIQQDEVDYYKTKSNIATQILIRQSKRLQELKDLGYFNDFRHVEFHELITKLYDDQGKSERIKNFPFPRQYASTALWLTMVFCALLPFAMLDIFMELAGWTIFFCPLISALLIWVYFLMEKIGDYSENPFEGTYNDVPITSIARGIEIDLREMLDDTNIPAPLQPQNGFLL